MKRPKILRWALAAVAAATFAASAIAHDIRVPLDGATPVRLSAAAEGVAIGNASVAGVSVQNDRLLFVTGRSYGSTSLVIVGANGRVLYNGRIVVSPDESGSVMVMRGAATSRMTCSPVCRPSPDIGDSAATYSAATEQITGHASVAGAH